MATEFVAPPTNASRLRGLAEILSGNREIADAYGALFGALRLTRQFDSGNSVLVTSTQPGEGKTTVSSSLAITASLAGQTVLLVDGDLQRASLTEAVGGPDAVGLIDILLGQAEAADAVRPVTFLPGSSRLAGVNFVAGGRKSPGLLGAVDWSKARAAFRSISQGFGIVVVDSPPILAANDGLLLAGIVDAVLLVVGAGIANLDELRRAKGELEATGTPVLGAVLNRFDARVHGRSNQPYRGYYHGSQR